MESLFALLKDYIILSVLMTGLIALAVLMTGLIISLRRRVKISVEIGESKNSNKEDAQNPKKSKHSKGNFPICWDYIVKTTPKVTKIVPWQKIIEKFLTFL
jgi:hypothetical protein